MSYGRKRGQPHETLLHLLAYLAALSVNTIQCKHDTEDTGTFINMSASSIAGVCLNDRKEGAIRPLPTGSEASEIGISKPSYLYASPPPNYDATYHGGYL